MSFASFLADAQAVRDRGEWLCIFTIPGPSGNVTLRVSRRGTAIGDTAVTIGSDTIAAHTPFRRRLIVAPSMAQSLWRSRTILGRSVPSFGMAELVNADGGLDPYKPALGYRWGAGSAKVYFCDFANIQDTIGLVYDGKLGKPDWGVGVPIKVPLTGRDADFQMMTSERIYRGTSYMLELNGTRVSDHGSPSAVNITGALTLAWWEWFDTAPGGSLQRWGWPFATGRPWAIVYAVSPQFRFACSVGGVSETVTMSKALSLKTPYHIAVVVSGRDVRFEIWDEDAQTLTTETYVNAISNATRQANSGGTLQLASGSSGVLWSDDMRVYNVALTPSELAAIRHRPLAAGSIPATCVHYLRCDDGSGTTVTDSSATAANGTISGAGSSAWLWACEGAAELAGTPKPDQWGEALNAPVLVDPIRNIFQVAGGGAVQSIVTDEGGVGHTMDANAASMRAFLTTTPAAGHSLPYLARGLFRLGSTPTLPICATVQGYSGGSVGYGNAAGTISRKLVTERGPLLADPGGLDTASFTAYATASSAKTGLFLPQPLALGEALDKVNAGAAGWWGFVRASALFHVERFAGPAVTADYSFDTRHIIDIQPASPPGVVYEVVVLFAYNPVVLSDDQAAAAFKGTVGWQLRRQAWQEQRRTDDALRAQYPGAAGTSVTIETCLQTQEDAGALADYLLALLKGEKEGWIVRLRATGLQVKVGQTCNLTFTLQDGTQRAGLDGTRDFAILSTEDLRQREEVKMEVWG